MAALRWDEHYGDREQALVAITYDADPGAQIAGMVEARLRSEHRRRRTVYRREWTR